MKNVFKVLIAKENFPVHLLSIYDIFKRILSELSSGCCSEMEAFFVSKVFILFLTYTSTLLVQIQADLCSSVVC